MFHKLSIFEIEIASSLQDLEVYRNDFGGRYVSAFLSGARYLFKQNLQGATEQTLSAFSHYKKMCGFVGSADFITIFWK